MKVLLTAFNQKLTSEVLDYPENTPMEIKLIIDFDRKPSFTDEEYTTTDKTVRKVGTFMRCKRSVFMENIKCVEYKLIDVS